MKLLEIFDSKVKSEISHEGGEKLTIKAHIKDRDIVFRAAAHTKKYPPNAGFFKKKSATVWEVAFAEIGEDGKPDLGLTGSGGAAEVFSFILDSMKELLKREAPLIIYFSTKKTESSREKFYERLIKKFAAPDYKLVAKNNESEVQGYWLERVSDIGGHKWPEKLPHYEAD